MVSTNIHFKIYCAGPLFNPKEKEEMQSIASSLEEAGYRVFLPQRDGLELANIFPALKSLGIPDEEASGLINHAIFSLDVYEVINSDGLVLNMNGRVPDEGAMVEAGIGWAHGKEVVIFNSDSRSLIQGNCNPLVMGLSSFECVSHYEDLPDAFSRKFQKHTKKKRSLFPTHFEETKKSGEAISSYLNEQRSPLEISELIIKLYRENLWTYIEERTKNSL